MPLFSTPEDRPSPRGALAAVGQSVGLLLGLCGWMMVAVALSRGGPFFGVALLGLLASAFARRAFIVTLVVEVVLFSACGALCPPGELDWLWTGGLCIGVARGAWLALWVRERRSG